MIGSAIPILQASVLGRTTIAEAPNLAKGKMPRNEDGEFELVLGNRQLLSVFFIVVVLLGVFFVMGYILGRNSSPVVAAEVGQRQPAKPMVIDSASKATPLAEKPVEPPPVDKPVEPVEKPAEPVAKKAEPPAPKPEVKREPSKPTEKAAEKPSDKASGKPIAGKTYLQVSAVDPQGAEVMVSTLKMKGFSAFAIPIPDKPLLVRVYVGPFADAAAIAEARAKLVAAGLKGNEAIKKTF